MPFAASRASDIATDPFLHHPPLGTFGDTLDKIYLENSDHMSGQRRDGDPLRFPILQPTKASKLRTASTLVMVVAVIPNSSRDFQGQSVQPGMSLFSILKAPIDHSHDTGAGAVESWDGIASERAAVATAGRPQIPSWDCWETVVRAMP